MSDDASTAYICIYCPFNSDNLQALESHLTNAHGHGCQDEASDSPNSQSKATKREAPDESPSPFDGTEGIKRVKRTSSPTNASLGNSSDEYSDIEDGDERDSANLLACPICHSTYSNFDRLYRHAKRKHQFDLSESNLPKPSPEQLASTSEITACPYCDFKTHDIELFKIHIIDHIRDKNYRCLLCNRLYKYRGDCSFHIRRKHQRYSVNSNDYIQRFLFETANEGDESTNAQSISNHSTNSNPNNREQDEPVRYFGCPYCDYTSNYGGDVRKHQARKHPNAESKVVKIIRQDTELVQPIDDDQDEESLLHSMNKSKSGKSYAKHSSSAPVLSNFAPVRVFECSSCHQQGTYKWVVERHIRAKHPDQGNVHVIELPAELSVKLQKISPPLKRFRCSLCPLQSKHSWVVIRHIKHFHTLQTASVLDIQPDGKPIPEDLLNQQTNDSDSSSTSESYHEEETPADDSMIFTYKCSLCDYQSNQSLHIQKHLNATHARQPNAYMITQYRSKKGQAKNGFPRSLSPASALAKAKFSPVVEEALLSLQTSKFNSNLYAVQPKFGIKRLKCRHCFYRSNWKTDMIRHVRIRHSLTEPDHNKDMIMMSDQEARATIELYESTFGKELRRRTFRTWNDWAKAEEEFTPKDGSLQYVNTNNGRKKSSKQEKTQLDESHQKNDEFVQLPNPSNIVSRLLLSTSPSHPTNDDAPLDLSLKSSTPKPASLIYLCSVCPYKHPNRTILQEHRTLHLTGQGLVCPHCSYVTSTEHSMKDHFSKTHLTSQYPRQFSSPMINQTAEVLEHDDEEFDIDSSDDEHQASTSQNLYDCPLCSPPTTAPHFHHLEQLTLHVLTLHSHQSCPFCSFVVHSQSLDHLLEHVKLHFNGTLVQPDPVHGIEQVKELCMLD